MKTVLVTGSQGFIGSYVCQELLSCGYRVVGLDNYSKYGRVARPQDRHEHFKLIECDLTRCDTRTIFLAENPNYIIAGAAMIGGITYFHERAYDLLATNERILANTFDGAIACWDRGSLDKIVAVSSSMVYETVSSYPTPETMIRHSPPLSTYGFQKLAVHYFCQGAAEQYGLPWTCVLPFNVVGIGEDKALGEKEIKSGNVTMLRSHVLPDFVVKALCRQIPFRILGTGSQVRCLTNGKDAARGIRLAMESERANGHEFNISNPNPITMDELARLVWATVNPSLPFEPHYETGLPYDVQMRVPDVTKARDLLGFEATIPVQQSINEVVEYMRSSSAYSVRN